LTLQLQLRVKNWWECAYNGVQEICV
jgi:hypothetical protein